jgi:hypothetical protein
MPLSCYLTLMFCRCGSFEVANRLQFTLEPVVGVSVRYCIHTLAWDLGGPGASRCVYACDLAVARFSMGLSESGLSSWAGWTELRLSLGMVSWRCGGRCGEFVFDVLLQGGFVAADQGVAVYE